MPSDAQLREGVAVLGGVGIQRRIDVVSDRLTVVRSRFNHVEAHFKFVILALCIDKTSHVNSPLS